MRNRQVHLTGRQWLWTSLVLFGALLLVACGGQATATGTPAPTAQAQPTSAPATPASPTAATSPAPTVPPATAATQAAVVPPTPACGASLSLTPSQTEGPYYKANTPQRTSLLEPGTVGTKLILTGYVLTPDCKPIAGAWLDFWQADGNGAYDNAGYRLRGHQFTDAAGRYYLETVLPGLYPGRTRHIHVKVRAPNQPVLTSQLYFPNEAANQSDGIFNRALIVTMQDTAGGQQATFHFVLNTR